MRCPAPSTLADLDAGTLPGRDQLRVRQHVGACARCGAALEAVSEARRVLDRARIAEPDVEWSRVEAGLPWRSGLSIPPPARSSRFAGILGMSMAGLAAAAAAVLLAVGPDALTERPALSIAERAPGRSPVYASGRRVVIPPERRAFSLVPTMSRGDVRVSAPGGLPVRLAPSGLVEEGSRIETGPGAIALQWGRGSGLSLPAHSELLVRSLDPRQVQLELLKGRVVLHVEKLQPDAPRPEEARLVVASAGLAVEVRGTVLEVARAREDAEVLVREGRVDVRRGSMRTHVGAGELGRFASAADAHPVVRDASSAELERAERADATLLLPLVSDQALSESAVVRIGAGRRVELDGIALGGAPLWTRVASGRHMVSVDGRSRWVRAERGEEIAIEARVRTPEAATTPMLRGRVAGAGAQNERAPEALACYERLGLSRDPSLEGVMELLLDVGPEGHVVSARIGASTLRAPSVDRCLTESALGWSVPGTGSPQHLQYWITLSRRD